MNKLKMHTSNRADENFAKLVQLFPNAITETIDENGEVVRAIDKDILMQEINTKVVDGNEERYQFTWPDKRRSILLANSPIAKTLRPCKEESVDFDNTENLYIEGDNLDVLKLLQETYLGKVKMIYIDPPYNTGNDFVYEDAFDINANEYKGMSGDYDKDGNRLVKNLDSNGRFHTDWLNMMYPRLKLAKDLLTDDGVIFISIDDNEVENLKKICSEIFGTQNYIGEIIWQTATDNNPSQIAIEHEYILCYAKNFIEQRKWTIQSEKAEQINKKHYELKQRYGTDLVGIRSALKEWIKDNEEALKGVAHYTYVDDIGVYYPGNSSNTKPGGYTFDIIHPVTKRICAKPEYGYRWPATTFWEADKRGDVEWGETENTIPKIKKRIETVTQMLKSYYYEDNRYWTKYLNTMLGSKVFENPKSVNLLTYFMRFVTSDSDIILDFFSGSATTAHAIMQLNSEDGGNRKFIMVQLPEETEEKSEAYKAGYKNICEIGKERIRRAGKKIVQEITKETVDIAKHGENYEVENIVHKYKDLDIGFRVLKCDSTNMKDVYYNPSDYETSLFDTLTDNIKEDRTPEDLLFQVMLDLGVLLSSTIEEREICGKKVFNVADGFLIACFDEKVTDETVKEIAKQKPYYFVMRDSSMASDSVAANFEQIFATYSPDTVRKVL